MAIDLKIGQAAPDFCAQAVGGKYGGGETVSLADLKGSPVVLYFYPKDDTPGCTVQACGVRDAWEELGHNAELFGVSIDSVASHQKFIKKYGLPFPLLSDPDKKIAGAYGVWVEKKMYGRKYMGVERSTFVLDPGGTISAILRKVKPEEHVGLVHDALEKMSS
jgi:peroxiredoxin Q/BCP